MARKRRVQYPGEKVLVAALLRRETTMTLTWIADHLRMGVPGHVAHLLYWQGRKARASENTLFWRPSALSRLEVAASPERRLQSA
jgi:hypothetical protein